VIVLLLWLLGALGGVALPVLSGNGVHVLLVIVVVLVLTEVLGGRRIE
jgi:hypothetical protein